MAQQDKKSSLRQTLGQNQALRIALIYLVISILWILFSDRALLYFVSSAENVTIYQTIKGWLFVIFSAGLLFVLMQRAFQARDQIEVVLRQTAAEKEALNKQLEEYTATLEAKVAERTQNLQEANEKLRSLDQLKTHFIADITHELRTPVTNLMMYIDLLRKGRPERVDHYVDVLQAQGNRLRRLIDGILELSRLEMLQADRLPTFAPLNLNELAAAIVSTFEPRADESGIELNFQPANHLQAVVGEVNQLSQAISNLLTNAFNFTENGIITVKTAQLETDKVSLEIQDTGMGIPADELPHIFDRFYRSERISQMDLPGTGLGLAIVKEIVTLHNGRIEIDSQLNQGTTIRVILPAIHSKVKGPLS